MKRLLIALAVLLAPTFAQAQTLKVNPAKSVLQWTGRKLIGGSHNGRLMIQSGAIVLENGKPVRGEVIVDMRSLVNDDLTDPEYNQKLVNHLKSADFFDVEKFPIARLVLTEIKERSQGTYDLKGTLEIKGHKREIAFSAKETREKDGRLVKADLVFNRADFDVRYGSNRFFDNLGDKVIKDEVELSVTVHLTEEGKKTASK